MTQPRRFELDEVALVVVAVAMLLFSAACLVGEIGRVCR